MTISLSKLRPADNTTAAIRHSIEAVAFEQASAATRLADAQSQRLALILEGSAAEVRGCEEKIKTIEIEVLQLNTLASALPEKLDAASAREWQERQDALTAEAAAACDAFNAWIAGQYAKYASAIADGVVLSQAVEAAVQAIDRGHYSMVRDTLPSIPGFFARGEHTSFHGAVVLPGVDGAPAYAHPVEHQRGSIYAR